MATAEPTIHEVFEPNTSTWQYVVADPATKQAVIIDSVLDFDPAKSAISTTSADALLALVREKGYAISKILETHVHADHLTASGYLAARLAETQGTRPQLCIGRRIGEVQQRFATKYGIAKEEWEGAFDKLFEDDELFEIGELKAKVVHLPGHTPDHLGYQIGSNVFCGDSLFNDDVGSARCDFPGGSAPALFASVRKLLGLPDHFRIWTGHDYPPGTPAAGGRTEPVAAQTVEQQNAGNKHLKKGVTEDEFVKWRNERDSGLAAPRLIHYALQFNIRAGRLPAATGAGDRFLHVPIKMPPVSW